MTSDQIKKAALKYFALNGYEGASLSHIANDVGIKKQSIYTHFSGKDDLFFQICRDAFVSELASIKDFITKRSSLPVKEVLYGFLLHCIERFERLDSAKFMVRISFFPPAHLSSEVLKEVYHYLDELESLFLPILETSADRGEILSSVDVPKAAAAFLGVMDAVIVEMLYGGPVRLQKRLDASWYLYWNGIMND
ncbi:TetR/AcrR family transcriptional regulator [Rossellomorea vietnamensis]|uniref:TetR/AcrR family transcriptional regulator n=1 Tax=Rossellomorea vietnamensis TaxID=218284 RepID=UPI003CF42BF6